MKTYSITTSTGVAHLDLPIVMSHRDYAKIIKMLKFLKAGVKA